MELNVRSIKRKNFGWYLPAKTNRQMSLLVVNVKS